MDHREEPSKESTTSCEERGENYGGHQLESGSSSPPPPPTDSISAPAMSSSEYVLKIDDIAYEPYLSELQMPSIVQLMKASLSEPYSIYTYRYFIHKWPQLCKLAMHGGQCVGAIVCKLEPHHFNIRRGYIAMLAVAKDFRRKKIGSRLVDLSIQQMAEDGCDEVVLETEVTNRPALSLYQNLGFVRDKYLHQYYLNGVDAYRLKLWLRDAFSDSL